MEAGSGACAPGPREMGQGQLCDRNRLLAPGEGKGPQEVKTKDMLCKANRA